MDESEVVNVESDKVNWRVPNPLAERELNLRGA
jgi:hypothetical protein